MLVLAFALAGLGVSLLSWALSRAAQAAVEQAAERALRQSADEARRRAHPHRPHESDPIEGYVPELRGVDLDFGPAPRPARRGKPWIRAKRPTAATHTPGVDDTDTLLHLLGRVVDVEG